MDQATLIAAVASIAIVVLGMALLSGGPNKAQQRAQRITGQDTGKRDRMSFLKSDDNNSARSQQIEESLGQIEAHQRNKRKKAKSLATKLIHADWSTSAQTFTIITMSVGAVAGLSLLGITGKPMVGLAAAFIIGFGLPRWFLGVVISKRQKKFTDNFPDAMDIIVRGVRTGLPLGDCLKIIAHESPEPVRSEFYRVIEAEAVGVPIEQCLERMYERIPVSEVNFFATVLNIQRQTGGNLGESLANLSSVIRGRKMLREKIKALSAEARMSASIIGALPFIVAILVTISAPDYMHELYTTPTGHRNLMISAAMMTIGTLVMRKMINFKI